MESLDRTFWNMRLQFLVADPTMTSFWVTERIGKRTLREGREERPVRMGSGYLAFESLQEEEGEGKTEN